MPCSALCAYAQLRCWAMRAGCVLASCALIGWAEIPSILPRHITGVQGWLGMVETPLHRLLTCSTFRNVLLWPPHQPQPLTEYR